MRKALLFTILLCACEYSKMSESGQFSMRYDHGWMESTNQPIGSGLKAVLAIYDSEGDLPIEPAVVTTNDPTIIEVASVNGNLISVKGHIAGESKLDIVTDDYNDQLSLSVRDIATAELTGFRAVSENAHPVQGAILPVKRSLYSEDGTRLTGFGIEGLQLSETSTLIGDTEDEHLIVQFEAEGSETLNLYGDELRLDVLSPQEVSRWQVESSSNQLRIGQSMPVSFYGETETGLLALAHLKSGSANICEVEPFLNSPELYVVSGNAAGGCVLLNGITGQTAIEIEIVE